ncbi:lipopolysaccharide biosynthesis protein [Dietzia cinnamea]|uniref:lipopolysaccharide biosynthesis protein n=1 Tax=Dietzia cinnamea TaxID=321318 RepID=UPI0021A78A7D|nr:hypothetical protein [Dietzia cinnamea]MCT2140671.1 hypothetical protein [Dietzia cinnamea]
MNPPISKSLGSRGKYNIIGTGAQGLVRFGVNAAIGRLGGPELLGNTAAAMSAAQVAVLFWPSSSGSAASKFVARSRGAHRIDEAVGVAGFVHRNNALATLLISIAAGLIWQGFGTGTDLESLFAVVALTVGFSLYTVGRGTQLGSGNERTAAILDVSTSAVALTGTVALLLLIGPSYFSLIPLALSYLIYGVLSLPPSGRKTPRVAKELKAEVNRFIVVAALGTLASAGFVQAAVIVTRRFAGATDAGNYAAAMTLVSPITLLAGTLAMSLFPSFSETWGSREEARFWATVDGVFRKLALYGTIGFSVYIAASPFVSKVVWGEQYAETQTILPIILAGYFFYTLAIPCTASLTSASNRGTLVAALASFSGATAGSAFWALSGAHSATAVSIGLFVGLFTTAILPIAVIVWTGRMNWALPIFFGTLALVESVIVAHYVRNQSYVAVPVSLVLVVTIAVFASRTRNANNRQSRLT